MSRVILICLLIFLGALIAPRHAAAFGKSITDAQNPQIIQDEESFKANSKFFHKVPFNETKYEFDIQLPKDWTSDPFAQKRSASAVSQKVLEDIARFKSPLINTQQAVVTIKSLQLEHEITAENWLKKYIFMNGYALQGNVVPISNKKASVSYVSTLDGKSTHTYAFVHINKDIAMMAQFTVPLSLKKTMEFLQKRVVDSFRLILTTEDPVESQRTFSVADVLKFSYPESWSAHLPDFKDPNSMSVQIHNETPDKKVEGLIRFVVVKRDDDTTLLKEVDKIKKYFDEFLHVKFKKLLTSDRGPNNSRFPFSRYETYEVEFKKKDLTEQKTLRQSQEVRFAVLGNKDWYVFAFLYSPSEVGDFSAWAYNTAAFDLVIKNVK